METFNCAPVEFPAKLNRVQYAGCQTTLTSNGLAAKDIDVIYSEDEKVLFAESIINQMTWKHRGDQPYISCFSDKCHARNWARKQPWQSSELKESSWEILIIDTSKMPDTRVISLKHVVTNLNLEIPEPATQHVEGAYLCVHKIPVSAIVRRESPETIVEGRRERVQLSRRLCVTDPSLAKWAAAHTTIHQKIKLGGTVPSYSPPSG